MDTLLSEWFWGAPESAQRISEFAVVMLATGLLAAIAAAVWTFRDAESRGKNGVAAALIVFLSAFDGLRVTAVVLCAWVLFRPAKRTQRDAMLSHDRLPEKLPTDIVGGPSSEEYLEQLEEGALR